MLSSNEISLIQHTVIVRCSQELGKLWGCDITQRLDCLQVSVTVWEWTLDASPPPRVEFCYPGPSDLLNNLDSMIERIIFHLQFQ
jgi:hypothetical protein